MESKKKNIFCLSDEPKHFHTRHFSIGQSRWWCWTSPWQLIERTRKHISHTYIDISIQTKRRSSRAKKGTQRIQKFKREGSRRIQRFNNNKQKYFAIIKYLFIVHQGWMGERQHQSHNSQSFTITIRFSAKLFHRHISFSSWSKFNLQWNEANTAELNRFVRLLCNTSLAWTSYGWDGCWRLRRVDRTIECVYARFVFMFNNVQQKSN